MTQPAAKTTPSGGDTAGTAEPNTEIAIENMDDEENGEETAAAPEEPTQEKESWGSKMAYILTLVGYAVGFGNIWRFPYQMRENGGLAFLIPYTLMVALVGLPIFFLELALGQRTRKGIVYAYHEAAPAFGGMGLTCACLCFVVGLYYNTLLAYCQSYLIDSFKSPLPWSSCNVSDSKNEVDECNKYLKDKSSKYYWYRGTLGISENIDTPGKYNWNLLIHHIVAWGVVWLILWKGTKCIGKVVYITAIMPYVVLIIFFIANLIIEPNKAWLGAWRLLSPDWSKLIDARTYVRAGGQIFFSLGVAYGCLVIFASYNPVRNNCFKDSIAITIINCATSLFASLVVFPIIGKLGYTNYETCVGHMNDVFPQLHANVSNHYDIYFLTKVSKWEDIGPNGTVVAYSVFKEITEDKENALKGLKKHDIQNLTELTEYNPKYNGTPFSKNIKDCSIGLEATASGGGSGFVFVGFTEAVKQLPAPQFFSSLFFIMLIFLGIDSGFGTVEGTVAALQEIAKISRLKSASIVCGIMASLAFIIFPFGWGNYILDLLDVYTANYTFLAVGILECIAISWVYGLAKFSYDVRLMTGKKPNLYLLACWKYISPAIIALIFLGSMIQDIMKSVENDGTTYSTFNPAKSTDGSAMVPLKMPGHSIATGIILMLLCMMWIPLQAILRNTKYNLLRHSDDQEEFPEEELRQERSINVNKEEDQFTTAEKAIMGKGSLHRLQEHRDNRSSTSIHKLGRGSRAKSLESLK